MELNPTTITVHNLVPTPTSPVFDSVDEEVDSHARFRRLDQTLGPALGPLARDYVWVYRPDSWIVAKKVFFESSLFSYWYYSDNERLHIDMLGLGKSAHSRILGQTTYENLTTQTRQFDPDDKVYSLFNSSPLLDSTLDVLTDLVGGRRTALAEIEARYAVNLGDTIKPILGELQRAGLIEQQGQDWHYRVDEHVFLEPLAPLVDLLNTEARLRNPTAIYDKSLNIPDQLAIELSQSVVDCVVEKYDDTRQYYQRVGPYGVFYRLREGNEALSGEEIEQAMRQAIRSLERYVSEGGSTSVSS